MMAVPMGLAFDSIYLCHHYVKSIPSVAVRLGYSLSDSQAGPCLSWFAGQAIPPMPGILLSNLPIDLHLKDAPTPETVPKAQASLHSSKLNCKPCCSSHQ